MAASLRTCRKRENKVLLDGWSVFSLSFGVKYLGFMTAFDRRYCGNVDEASNYTNWMTNSKGYGNMVDIWL